MELEQTNRYLDIDENFDDEKLFRKITGHAKYRCLSSTIDENGQVKYLNISKEDLEEYMDNHRQKMEEQEEVEDAQTNEQIADIVTEDKNRVKVIKEGDEQNKNNNANSPLKEMNRQVKSGKEAVSNKKENEAFNWTTELEDKLEELIEEYCFDFSKVAEQFNATLKKDKESQIEEQESKGISTDEIRKKWTEVELKRYRPEIRVPDQVVQEVAVGNKYDELE